MEEKKDRKMGNIQKKSKNNLRKVSEVANTVEQKEDLRRHAKSAEIVRKKKVVKGRGA